MSQRGPGAGQVLVGIFLVLFGLCITLVGGGCTLLMLNVVASSPTSDAIPMLLVSLAVLAGGLASIWAGIKLMSGR